MEARRSGGSSSHPMKNLAATSSQPGSQSQKLNVIQQDGAPQTINFHSRHGQSSGIRRQECGPDPVISRLDYQQQQHQQQYNNINTTAPMNNSLKTRNFTQVPSIKSSPIQRVQLQQEEDYCDEDDDFLDVQKRQHDNQSEECQLTYSRIRVPPQMKSHLSPQSQVMRQSQESQQQIQAMSLGTSKSLRQQPQHQDLEKIEERPPQQKYYKEVDQEFMMTDQDFDGLETDEHNNQRQQRQINQETAEILVKRHETLNDSQEGNIPRSSSESHSSRDGSSPHQYMHSPNSFFLNQAGVREKQLRDKPVNLQTRLITQSHLNSFQRSSQIFQLAQKQQQLNFKLQPQPLPVINAPASSEVSPSPLVAMAQRNKECNETAVNDQGGLLPLSGSEEMMLTSSPPIQSMATGDFPQSQKVSQPLQNVGMGSQRATSSFLKIVHDAKLIQTDQIPIMTELLILQTIPQPASQLYRPKQPKPIESVALDSNDAKQQLQDDETELLKQEYLKLKQTLSKLKSGSVSQQQFESRTTSHNASVAKRVDDKSRRQAAQTPNHQEQERQMTLPLQRKTQMKLMRPNSSNVVENLLISNGTLNQESEEKPTAVGDKKGYHNLLFTQEQRSQVKPEKIIPPALPSQEDLIYVAQKNKKPLQQTAKPTSKRVLDKLRQALSQPGSSSNSSSSFEDFQKAATTSHQMRQRKDKFKKGQGQEDSDDDQSVGKQLIISNLKSQVSHTNTACKKTKAASKNRRRLPLSNSSSVEDQGYGSSASKKYLSSSSSKEEQPGNATTKRLQYYEEDNEHEDYFSSSQDHQQENSKRSKKKQSKTGGGGKSGTRRRGSSSRMDRKHLKININMKNGYQFMNSVTGGGPANGASISSTTNTQPHFEQQPQTQEQTLKQHYQTNEEFLQRQILQQQQLLLAAIAQQQQQQQYQQMQPHSLLLQQQLAFQQQQLLLSQQTLIAQAPAQPPLGPSIMNQGYIGQQVHSQYQGGYGHHFQNLHAASIHSDPKSMTQSLVLNEPSSYQNYNLLKDTTLTQPPSIRGGTSNSITSPQTRRAQGIIQPLFHPQQQTVDYPQIGGMYSPKDFQLNGKTSYYQPVKRAPFQNTQILDDRGNDYKLKNVVQQQSRNSNRNGLPQTLSSPVKNNDFDKCENQSEIFQVRDHHQKSHLQSVQFDFLSQQDEDDEYDMRRVKRPLDSVSSDIQMRHRHPPKSLNDHWQQQQLQSNSRISRKDVQREELQPLQQRKTGHFGENMFQGVLSGAALVEEHWGVQGNRQSRSSESDCSLEEEGVTQRNEQLTLNKHSSQTNTQVTSINLESPTQRAMSPRTTRVSAINLEPSSSHLLSSRHPACMSLQLEVEEDCGSMLKEDSVSISNTLKEDLKSETTSKALWIGFDDELQVKDPFKGKPVLKNRLLNPADATTNKIQKDPIFLLATNRSKSAKGNFTAMSSKLIQGQRTTKNNKPVEEEEVVIQLKEPNEAQSLRSSSNQQPLIQSQPLSKEFLLETSPIKHHFDRSPIKANSDTVAREEVKVLHFDTTSKTSKHAPAKKPLLGPSKKSSLAVSGKSLDQTKRRAPDMLLVSKRRSPQKQMMMQEPRSVQIDLKDFLDTPKASADDDDDLLDPSHNKEVVVEILVTKNKQNDQLISLAEMFKAKKREVVEKLINRKQHHHLTEEVDPQTDIVDKKEKSKKELFELRKKMMKSTLKAKADNFTPGTTTSNTIATHSYDAAAIKQGAQRKDPKQDLMVRLAQGKKTSVDQKEMKRLTKQNYQNLPEMKKKREEEKKRSELQARKAATQEYLKQLDDTRRKKVAAASVKKKTTDTPSNNE